MTIFSLLNLYLLIKNIFAGVAQLAERLICNQNVVGSSPIVSFINNAIIFREESLITTLLFYWNKGEALYGKSKK